MQKGIFVLLVLIAFLLGANLFKGNDAKAAKAPKIEYAAAFCRGDKNVVQETLNFYATNNWELVTIDANYGVYIFTKKH